MKDPAFLFYPGDYLRDTQVLSEKAQVAYDRIMCEHMRNICITQQQLKFFTKRLSDEEKEELLFLLKEVDGGFQIEWVAESIVKRRAYSQSRSDNRKKKEAKNTKNISSSYVPHMENENENENIDDNGTGNASEKKPKTLLQIITDEWHNRFLEMVGVKYAWNDVEIKTLKSIIQKLKNLVKDKNKVSKYDPATMDTQVIDTWMYLMEKLPTWYAERPDLKIINSKFNAIIAEIKSPYNKGKKLVTDTYKAFGIDV